MNYLNTYYLLIDSRRNLKRNCYLEEHHIVPKSIYGKGLMDESHSNGMNDFTNLIKLSAREHFVAHWLLHRAFPKNKKLQGAFWAMCLLSPSQKRNYVPSSRAFKEAREAHVNSLKKSVAMYSFDGSLIDSFNSITEASETMQLLENSIGQAANGKSKSCGGYQWRFYDTNPKSSIGEYKEIQGNSVPVAQYNLDGVLIQHFKSFEEAERVLDIKDSTIRAAINRGSKPKNLNYFFRAFEKQQHIPEIINSYIEPCSSDSKAIVMLSSDYTYFIKRFRCIKYAMSFLNKTGRETISRVCNEKRMSSLGYGWMWEDDYDLDLPKKDFNEVKLYEHSKPINCYNLDGKFIKQFSSASIAEKILGVSNISRAATKPYGISKVFQFRYFSEVQSNNNISSTKLSENKPKKILKIDIKSLCLIEEFDSIAEAAISTGNIKNRFNISNCTKEKRKTAYGFIWKNKFN